MKKGIVLILLLFLYCFSAQTGAAQSGNVVTDWAAIVQVAINNANAPRPPASSEVLHAMIQLAMYDAAITIEGGYEPYAYGTRRWTPAGADVRAAVATAAYRTARMRVEPSQVGYLDGQYTTYMAGIPAGLAKNDGIQVGERAAAVMLALRANDGFNNVVVYQCSSIPPAPGEFEPNGGCGTQPVDTKLGEVMPFTFRDADQFRPDGPSRLTSKAYTRDFIETRDYGRVNSAFRSPEQTDVAYFWSEHAYVHWNRNLINLAVSHGLNVRETSRLFAMVHTAAADAVIAGFRAKYFYKFWRPRTAIPLAGSDGNRDTEPDPLWTPLLTVNHPEYPSAHTFWSTALTDAIAKYFRTRDVTWTLVTSKTAVPQLVKSERRFEDLTTLMDEIGNARVWAGLHWRQSIRDGGEIGRKVARHVTRNFFQPTHRN